MQKQVDALTQFVVADFFEFDFTKATVVTMYLLPSINLVVPRQLAELRASARAVSQGLDVGNWRPRRRCEVESKFDYLWTISARK